MLICTGLYQFLEKRRDAGTLDEVRNDDGSIHCVFLCCDLPYQYIGDYFSKVDESNFHPVRNNVRIGDKLQLAVIHPVQALHPS